MDKPDIDSYRLVRRIPLDDKKMNNKAFVEVKFILYILFAGIMLLIGASGIVVGFALMGMGTWQPHGLLYGTIIGVFALILTIFSISRAEKRRIKKYQDDKEKELIKDREQQ